MEITQRLEGLDAKFGCNHQDLGDYQILEISQDKTLEAGFNKVLEKITELAGLVSGGGEEVENLLKDAVEKKDAVIVKKAHFSKHYNQLCPNVTSRQTN